MQQSYPSLGVSSTGFPSINLSQSGSVHKITSLLFAHLTPSRPKREEQQRTREGLHIIIFDVILSVPSTCKNTSQNDSGIGTKNTTKATKTNPNNSRGHLFEAWNPCQTLPTNECKIPLCILHHTNLCFEMVWVMKKVVPWRQLKQGTSDSTDSCKCHGSSGVSVYSCQLWDTLSILHTFYIYILPDLHLLYLLFPTKCWRMQRCSSFLQMASWKFMTVCSKKCKWVQWCSVLWHSPSMHATKALRSSIPEQASNIIQHASKPELLKHTLNRLEFCQFCPLGQNMSTFGQKTSSYIYTSYSVADVPITDQLSCDSFPPSAGCPNPWL